VEAALAARDARIADLEAQVKALRAGRLAAGPAPREPSALP